MTRLERTLERELRHIADRATPSPDAWESILTRIADQDPNQETEIIMLTENTTPTRRWPLVAAAAAVIALLVAGVVYTGVDGGDEQIPAGPADTVAPTPDEESPDNGAPDDPTTDSEGSSLQPDAERETDGQLDADARAEVAAAEADVADSDDVAELTGDGARLTLAAGTYRSVHLGVPITFTVPELVKVGSLEPGTIWLTSYGPGDLLRGLAMTRVGSWFTPDEAADPTFTGLGSIAPDAVDEWIQRNGIPVDEASTVTIGGRTAKHRAFTIPPDQPNTYDDSTACHYPEWQPCFWADSASADTFDPNTRDYQVMSTGGINRLWLVDMDGYEPLLVRAYGTANTDAERMAAWLDDVVPQIIASIELGEPAPAVPGGTARLPERVAVTADVTVTQTGTRDIEEPWPIERTGTLDGDITGTFTGTGISSPNGAEVTLDWVIDATIDGLGTGTLTLRSDETWSGDGATTAVDVVIGGTGDFEGVTGFGSTTHTDDGDVFTATIELMLAPPVS